MAFPIGICHRDCYTVDDDALIAMNGVAIAMAYAVDSGYLHAAAFAVEEVDGLPDAAAPGVIGNAEGAGHGVAGADDIGAGLADFGKLERLIRAEFGLRA